MDYTVQITNRISTGYLVTEIPIPAGCTYSTKPSARYGEAYREYHKDKLLVYYEKFPAGTHEIRLKLDLRFAGEFQILPVNIENIYNTEESGHSKSTTISVAQLEN